MDTPSIERVPLASLLQDTQNPRYRTDRAKATIAASLRQYGPARAPVCDQDGVLAAGNGTVEAALAIGIKDAIIVDGPDDALVIVRKQFTKAQRRGYSIADNQTTDLSVFTDESLLEAFEELVLEDFPLTETGFTSEEIDQLLAAGDAAAADGDPEEDVAPEDLFRAWPSDNEWGVPTLDLNLQATDDDLLGVIHKWGTRKRGEEGPHLIHCYADDYKFWGLHRNPQAVVATGCKACVEPNYSTWPTMARAEALWWLYSKRVIGRWWQSKGVRLFVDLNVNAAFSDLSLLGVPPGWRAYATRWHESNDEAAIERDHADAVERRGSEDVLLVVFGGGQKVRRMCEFHGWHHITEDVVAAKRGRDG